ncbi:prephenate dehydrogenase [Bacillus massiliglaciei]|uniref:prephenate dehydrogenase n=1 Tax=Bacillus massiliglaciei TaxID=1816693 RepID=UPI000B2C4CCC|nr:prephenate dehydrogenase [Bacillus massiliglaciei]
MNGKVLIIGLGLIGGSLGLAIRQAHPLAEIAGYDVDGNNLQLAKLLGIIDEAALDLKDYASNADLILIAVPVNASKKIMEELSGIDLKSDVIISDTGSTKETVVSAAERLLGDSAVFIGGHPMAGSHKSGAGAAKLHLFENAFYLLTPSKNVQKERVDTLKQWLKGTNANFLVVEPDAHDLMTGVISHFPHVVAAGLVKQAEKSSKDYPLVSRLAAGGFRDITRIASSSPEMWRDISLHNKEVLLTLMEQWEHEMTLFKDILISEDGERIQQFFSEAKSFRDELPIHAKGAIPSFYDLYIDIPDYAGVISEITGYLAEEGISITNIRIIETREEIYGVLVISFQSDIDRMKASECIQRHTNYETIFA